MKNVYLTMFLFVTMVIQSNTVFAEKIAVTTKSDGFKKVILKDDGTWAYYENREVTAYEQFLIKTNPEDFEQNEKLLKCIVKKTNPKLIKYIEKTSGLLTIMCLEMKKCSDDSLKFVFGNDLKAVLLNMEDAWKKCK